MALESQIWSQELEYILFQAEKATTVKVGQASQKTAMPRGSDSGFSSQGENWDYQTLQKALITDF